MLVFGEDDHDRECIKILLEGLRPDLARRVKKLRQPLVLIKNAKPSDVPDRAQTIAGVVDAEREAGPVACVFAHEDCDEVEPALPHQTRATSRSYDRFVRSAATCKG